MGRVDGVSVRQSRGHDAEVASLSTKERSVASATSVASPNQGFLSFRPAVALVLAPTPFQVFPEEPLFKPNYV